MPLGRMERICTGICRCRWGQVHFAHRGIDELERQCMRFGSCELPFLVGKLEYVDGRW